MEGVNTLALRNMSHNSAIVPLGRGVIREGLYVQNFFSLNNFLIIKTDIRDLVNLCRF